MNTDRHLVELIKARAADGLCRTCGYDLDEDRACDFCGNVTPKEYDRPGTRGEEAAAE